jgi:Serine/threonine protein kinase
MSFDKKHPEFLDLKNRIREKSRDFIAFVGAGLSIPAGIPGWEGLRTQIIECAIARAQDYPEGLERDGYLAAVNRLGDERDLWQCFTDLEKMIPAPTYEGFIAKALTLTHPDRTPHAYDSLWQLGIKGIITFNLDMCALNSYSRHFKQSVDSATGHDISRYSSYLSSAYKFVFQPHGIVTSPRTWVFTMKQRSALLNNQHYVDFMKSVFHSKNVFLIGFNPTDFAFDYILQSALLDSSSTGSKHFVLLPNPSPSLISSLGDRGVGVIPYRPVDEKHAEVQEMLDDLLGFVPKDGIPPSAYIGDKLDPSALPSPKDILDLSLEETRKLLNQAISSFAPEDGISTIEYVEKLEIFYKKYMQAIYNCWLLEPESEFDQLHGYKVIRSVGRGAFGQVYEAENPATGDRAAVKVLLNEVKSKRDYLNSFRRGVNSMRILTKHKVAGMVPIKSAFEIPACIFMDFIDGPTLNEARTNGYISSLHRSLETLVRVGEVVHSAHNLEERVLHRDLKPSNVILKDCYGPMDDINAVVLDFDLSWYKGALDVSVVHGARAQGYAAPEQTATGLKPGVSTRNTAVDVFGYGMLAYFLFIGEDPRPNEQNFKGYNDKISSAISHSLACKWACLPRYLSLVVERCTVDIQSERIGFSEAVDFFRNAWEMTTSDTIFAKNPLLVLEIACRVESEGKMTLSEFEREARIVGPIPSKEVVVKLCETGTRICLTINLTKTLGVGELRNVTKYIDSAAKKCVSKLRAFPFDKAYSQIGQSRVDIIAEWFPPPSVNLDQIESLCDAVTEARAGLIFD